MKGAYRPILILSKNSKTAFPSINLPRTNCRPTPLCNVYCYARFGHISLACSIKKQQWVSDYLQRGRIDQLIDECLPHRFIRWCGSGDILPAHVDNILRLAEACPDTFFFGMTRRLDLLHSIVGILPNLTFLLTVDSTTRFDGELPYRIAYGPRVHEEVPADDRIAVVFPVRTPGGRVLKGVTHHQLDCPASWDHSVHCITCQRCFGQHLNASLAAIS